MIFFSQLFLRFFIWFTGRIVPQVDRPLWQGKVDNCVTGLTIGIGERLTMVANTKVDLLKILKIKYARME